MQSLLASYYGGSSIILLLIGFYILIVSPNLIKKVLGINIMETAIFLFLVSIGKMQGGTQAPIVTDTGAVRARYVSPLPQHMVILGVLMTLGITSFALILAVKIFTRYNTLNCNKLRRMI